MIFRFKLSEFDNITSERVRYLNVYFSISVLMIWSYVLRDLFIHHSLNFKSLNFFLAVALILVPFLNLKINNYYRTTILALLISLLSVTLLIFDAGGVSAPGSFWLASYPITFGILLGEKGVKAGSIILLLVLGVLLYLEHLGIRGSFVMDEKTFHLERIINLVNFAFYIILNTYYFIRNESKSRSKLKEKSEEVENLLRIVVHDLSTPLTVCGITLEQLVEEQKEQQTNNKKIARLSVGFKNLSDIISQVKLMKSVKDGKVEVKKELLNVDSMIKKTMLMAEVVADKKNVKLDYQSLDSNLQILGEEIAFCNIIFLNFLTNAIKFSDNDGVVEIKLFEKNKNILITVKDSGIGIPGSLINDLWNMNIKTSRPGTAGEKGTGYGMPLAHEYIEKMNGKIDVASVVKTKDSTTHGTTFTIYFPRAK